MILSSEEVAQKDLFLWQLHIQCNSEWIIPYRALFFHTWSNRNGRPRIFALSILFIISIQTERRKNFSKDFPKLEVKKLLQHRNKQHFLVLTDIFCLCLKVFLFLATLCLVWRNFIKIEFKNNLCQINFYSHHFCERYSFEYTIFKMSFWSHIDNYFIG